LPVLQTLQLSSCLLLLLLLQAEDVMSKAKVSASFAVVESSENLVNTLDAHKTSGAFPVISVPARPGEVGDFMGIISRAR
jgi:hypothetical protein